jgi:hypothetical protein
MNRHFLRKGDPKGDPEQIGPKMAPTPGASNGAFGDAVFVANRAGSGPIFFSFRCWLVSSLLLTLKQKRAELTPDPLPIYNLPFGSGNRAYTPFSRCALRSGQYWI